MADTDDEREVLREYLTLAEDEAEASAKLKTAQESLMTKVAAKYGQLTEAKIQTLVVDDKWLATLAAAVQGELDRVSQTLTGRIRQLAERYASPLPQIVDEVATLSARVDAHLKRMENGKLRMRIESFQFSIINSQFSIDPSRLQTDRGRRHPGGVGRVSSCGCDYEFPKRVCIRLTRLCEERHPDSYNGSNWFGWTLPFHAGERQLLACRGRVCSSRVPTVSRRHHHCDD